jgi:F-type H+-transporting ATPase subunit delta
MPSSFDPAREHLGEIYAKALLGATEKAGTRDAIVDELGSLVTDVLDKLPHVAETLASLRLAHEDRVRILDKAFAGKMSPVLLDFLKVLSRHNRLDSLREIHRAAQKQLNTLRGRVEVFVTSAAPINNQLIDQITGKLTKMLGGQVILQMRVDPDLLGGLVVRVGDKVFDSSLATQLHRMKETALEKTEQQIRHSADRFLAAEAM